MADDNRPLKYMRYAIGEVVLVVIGILIALQINNWNEERKDKEKIDIYIQGLLTDLKMDSIQLNSFIGWVETENKILNNQMELIKSPDTVFNLDSIMALLPNINLMNPAVSDFSDATFNTLVSTGDIGLLPNYQVENLMKLNRDQNNYIKIFDTNHAKIYAELISFLKDYGFLFETEKNSLFYKSMTNSFNESGFLKNLNSYMGFKFFLYGLLSDIAKDILKQTNQTSNSIKQLKN